MCFCNMLTACVIALQGGQEVSQKSTVVRVDQEQSGGFTDVGSDPVPSLLHAFSTPMKTESEVQTDADLVFLLAHNTGVLPSRACSARIHDFEHNSVLVRYAVY